MVQSEFGGFSGDNEKKNEIESSHQMEPFSVPALVVIPWHVARNQIIVQIHFTHRIPLKYNARKNESTFKYLIKTDVSG